MLDLLITLTIAVSQVKKTNSLFSINEYVNMILCLYDLFLNKIQGFAYQEEIAAILTIVVFVTICLMLLVFGFMEIKNSMRN